MNKTVYVVTYNGYEGLDGLDMYLYGVFTSFEAIPKEIRSNNFFNVQEVSTNDPNLQENLGRILGYL